MGAKQSAEMKRALEMVAFEDIPVSLAASRCGVCKESLYFALKQYKKSIMKKFSEQFTVVNTDDIDCEDSNK